MKKIWQYILLAALMLVLAVSVALIMEHIVMGILDREEAREFEIAVEAYRQQAERLDMPIRLLPEPLPPSWTSIRA